MNAVVKRSPADVAIALQKWLSRLPTDWPPADPATTTFCRQRLDKLADEAALTAKLEIDLGDRPWRPLGHVLAVVSENDHMGVVMALVAAALTGNRLTLKSHAEQAALQSLREALNLDETEYRIADWESQVQNDVELLAGVDGILMAGSEALIRHYRKVAAPSVRLIEYGPQMSAACIVEWPSSAMEQAVCVDALIRDTTLFMQNVCSSPQFVLVPDGATARALLSAVAARLPTLAPLPAEIRLEQSAKVKELRLLQRLGKAVEVMVDADTGWAATYSPPDLSYWLPRGFRLIVGRVDTLPDTFPPLQTLGIWPSPECCTELGAMHRCRLGRMHERSVSTPHDGHWELAQWVRFVSCDNQ